MKKLTYSTKGNMYYWACEFKPLTRTFLVSSWDERDWTNKYKKYRFDLQYHQFFVKFQKIGNRIEYYDMILIETKKPFKCSGIVNLLSFNNMVDSRTCLGADFQYVWQIGGNINKALTTATQYTVNYHLLSAYENKGDKVITRRIIDKKDLLSSYLGDWPSGKDNQKNIIFQKT